MGSWSYSDDVSGDDEEGDVEEEDTAEQEPEQEPEETEEPEEAEETEETVEQESEEEESEEVEDAEEEEEEFENFEEKLRAAIGLHEDPTRVTTTELYERVDEIDDVELLRTAYQMDDRSSARDYYESRVEDLGSKIFPADKVKEDEEQSGLDEVDGNGDDDEVEEMEVEDGDGEVVESVSDEDENGQTVTPIDTSTIAADSMTTEEAAEKDHRWKILVWGPPGLFKTHFCFTMPEPVCILDTEGKAHDIAHKFKGKVTHIFQPENYEEAVESLHEAIELLEQYKEEQGVVGTIAVDSMSIMWDWSQQHYIDKWYPQADSLAEAREEFQSAMQSGGAGDWKKIKEYHNEQFREVMLNSDFHICWTAMSTEDYGQVIEENLDYTPKKPSGEKNNVYKVDQILRGRWDDDGQAVGDLEKAGLTRSQYRGLVNPTFEKHKKVVEGIKDLEEEEADVDVITLEEEGAEVEVTQRISSRG